MDMQRESNNRLNDDDRAEIEEERKKKRDDWGQHLCTGSEYRTTVYESERKDNKRVTNDYQYTSNGNVVQ